MTIDEVVVKSRPRTGRKYENMTVLQRLRCDLYDEAVDYDHAMMHARTPYLERKTQKLIGDELVTLAQDYAWRYTKHRQIELLDTIIAQAKDNRITHKNTIIELMEAYRKINLEDLAEYQRQFKNMTLM